MSSPFVLDGDPPPEVAAERTRLLERAAALVADLKPQTWTRRGDAPSETPEPGDCSVEGSGFLSLYYLGVHAGASRCGRVVRYAGASSGAQAPFQQLLQGEAQTIDTHLAHGLRCDRAKLGLLRAIYYADAHWKALAGVLCVSGYLAKSEGFELAAAAASPPVLHCHGVVDEVVRIGWAREREAKREAHAGMSSSVTAAPAAAVGANFKKAKSTERLQSRWLQRRCEAAANKEGGSPLRAHTSGGSWPA